MYDRKKIVDIMKSWIGKRESNGSHKSIIDIYNSIKPLPVGYKVKYTDSWCAATVSAAFHQAGYDDIFPSECSCQRMIAKAKTMGCWKEQDNYIPSPGDVILYDWQDNGIGDNVGQSDHVGVVEYVSSGVIHVIEGNYADSVKMRDIAVNGRYIRGFVTPKFDDPIIVEAVETIRQAVKEKHITDYVLGKVYTLNTALYVRKSPNGEKKKFNEMTADGMRNGRRDSQGKAVLNPNTRITVNDTQLHSNGSLWLKCPSGWVCAVNKDGKKYIV